MKIFTKMVKKCDPVDMQITEITETRLRERLPFRHYSIRQTRLRDIAHQAISNLLTQAADYSKHSISESMFQNLTLSMSSDTIGLFYEPY